MSEASHPTPKLYVKVALWLGVITAIEVLMSYVGLNSVILLVSLLIAAVAKFVIVAGYFMHLKFDQPVLRRPMMLGIFLALGIYTAMLANLILHSNTA